ALTCCIRSKRFIGVSRVPRSQIALALLTRMSMPPKVSTVFATAARTCSSSRMSHRSASARPPAASTAFAAVWMVPGSLGLGTSDLAAMATLAPSRAARSAIARPMPREPPVMKRVLPESVDVMIRTPGRSSHGCDRTNDRTWRARLWQSVTLALPPAGSQPWLLLLWGAGRRMRSGLRTPAFVVFPLQDLAGHEAVDGLAGGEPGVSQPRGALEHAALDRSDAVRAVSALVLEQVAQVFAREQAHPGRPRTAAHRQLEVDD